jgi:DDE superfamily endonuclease
LQEGAAAGVIDLVFLDESGFAPTLPTGYTWARKGARAVVRDEPSQGRRLNVLGALAPLGAEPWLIWTSPPGKLDAAVLLAFLWHEVAGLATALGEVPPGYRRARPLVVVLDNYSVHRSTAVKEAAADLARVGVRLFFLPPYSSELNRIEPLWRQVTYHDLPVRSYQTLEALRIAVDNALKQHADALTVATKNLPEAA